MPSFPQTTKDYSDKDFDSIRARLFNLISSVYPEWSDQNVATFGNLFIESFAFVGDILGYYLDNHALESRIATATQRKSLLALSKLIGFTAFSATASQTDLVFTLSEVAVDDVIIPAHTLVKTQQVTGQLEFRTLSEVTITAGNLQQVVTVENAEITNQVFAKSGLVHQEVVLAATPFISTSLSVSSTNGAYINVQNFLSSASTDKHYTVTVDQNDRATIKFGNAVNGELPTGPIQVSYKTGGGTDGNIDENTITLLDGNFVDQSSSPVILTVNNPDKANGGTDRQSLASIKEEAPASIRTVTRSVSREDFETNALRVPGVDRATMITSDEKETVPENSGILYIVPSGGGSASTALKEAVLEMVTVDYPSTLTFKKSVESANYLTIDIVATVFLSSNAVATTVKNTINTNLASFFSTRLDDGSKNPNIDFGANFLDASGNTVGELPYSDIYNVIRDSNGVRKMKSGQSGLLVNNSSGDTPLDADIFPVLGNVSIINGDTGVAI